MPGIGASRGGFGGGLREAWTTLRLALRVRRDELAFTRHVAGGVVRYLRGMGVEPAGLRVLDAGTGSGAVPEALAGAGARAVGLDLADHRSGGVASTPFVLGTGERLPFGDGAFNGAVSSNVLEHVPDPWAAIGELVRVVRPGGFVYLSFTNWLSPIGGHEWSPFHYLGPRLGVRAYRWLRGRPPAWNVPGRTLFVVHVGPVLRGLHRSGLHVVDVAPRYWPSLRFLARVPGLREVAMWNCVVLLRRPVRPRPTGA